MNQTVKDIYTRILVYKFAVQSEDEYGFVVGPINQYLNSRLVYYIDDSGELTSFWHNDYYE